METQEPKQEGGGNSRSHEEIATELRGITRELMLISMQHPERRVPRERLIEWVRKYEREYLPALKRSEVNFQDSSDTPLGKGYVTALRELLRDELPRFDWNSA